MKQIYYNPQAECAPREQIEKLQAELLKSRLEFICRNGLPYAKKLRAAGIEPQDIRTIDDIKKLPFTDREDIGTPVLRGDVVRLHGTSGTSGKMLVIPCTARDLELFCEGLCRALTMLGCGKNSVVQNTFGYSMFVGGHGIQAAAEKLGAVVIPTSVGNTARQIEFMREFKTDILCGTPSYVLHIACEAEKLGLKREDFALKSCFIAGERPPEGTAEIIAAKLGADVYDVYGSAEMTNVFAPCSFNRGKHIPEDMIYAEIVNGDEPAGDNVLGELVITTLAKTGLPLIRYRTHDIAAIDSSPCPCGRTGKRLVKTEGRTDDVIFYKGCKIYPSQIEFAIKKYPALTGRYQIVAGDKLLVIAEARGGAAADGLSEILTSITGVNAQAVTADGLTADGGKIYPVCKK